MYVSLVFIIIFCAHENKKRKTICLTESNQNVEQGGERIDLASTHNTYVHIIYFFILSSYKFLFLRANFHQINKLNLNFASLLFFDFIFLFRAFNDFLIDTLKLRFHVRGPSFHMHEKHCSLECKHA